MAILFIYQSNSITFRRSQILHTRLRTKCSLNYDIYLKNLTDSPLCRCGDIENSQHYFLYCRYYYEQTNKMLRSLSQLCNVSLDVLLFGDCYCRWMLIHRYLQLYRSSSGILKDFSFFLLLFFGVFFLVIFLLFCPFLPFISHLLSLLYFMNYHDIITTA